MNRLQPTEFAFDLSADDFAEPSCEGEAGAELNLAQGIVQEHPAAKQLGGKRRQSLAHSVFVPLHYEPNYAYPLLVWLHGSGDDERQLKRVMPLISLRNYVAAAPRGASEHRLASGETRGYGWRQTESDISRAEDDVIELLGIVQKRFNIAPRRIFLAGYGAGGTMAFRLGLAHPELFAGVLSIGGAFPQRESLPGESEPATQRLPLARIDELRGLPLFVAQGRDARRYNLQRVCDNLRLFHSAGMSVTLRQYPCGDELTTQMLTDLDAWIMELVTGVPASSGEETGSGAGEWN